MTRPGRALFGAPPRQYLVWWMGFRVSCRDAPEEDQARRLQVLRRSYHHRFSQSARRGRRPQRLRQVERHRRRALGHGREFGQAPPRRLARGRHLLGLRSAQARRPGQRRTRLRQPGRRPRRPVCELQRDLGPSSDLARRAVGLLAQRQSLPAPRHHRYLPRHGARAAQLCDHRAGDDLAHHRGPSGGTPGLSRGGRRGLEIQGPA